MFNRFFFGRRGGGTITKSGRKERVWNMLGSMVLWTLNQFYLSISRRLLRSIFFVSNTKIKNAERCRGFLSKRNKFENDTNRRKMCLSAHCVCDIIIINCVDGAKFKWRISQMATWNVWSVYYVPAFNVLLLDATTLSIIAFNPFGRRMRAYSLNLLKRARNDIIAMYFFLCAFARFQLKWCKWSFWFLVLAVK